MKWRRGVLLSGISTLIGIITFTVLIIVSCNRKDVTSVNVVDNSTKDMLVKYLVQQKNIDASASSFIDTLISKSDWNNISQTTISKYVKLIYLPLSYNDNNTGITFMYYNNTGMIYKSLITEIPKNKSSNISHTTSTNLNRPIDIITGFYNYNMKGYTGSIRAYSLNNNFLWEYGYENGTQKFEKWVVSSSDAHPSSGTSQIKSNSIASNTIKANGCLDWYTVTWYDDGTSDWHFIGTTCDGNCLESIGITQDSLRIKSNCNGTGGGAGGSNLSYKIITNNITDPCLKKLINNLQTSNRLTNKVGAILQNVFGVNNKTNLTFYQDNNLNDNGVPLAGEAKPEKNNPNNYIVTLNAAALNNFSQERQTLTIMHEILHDYFWYKYSNSGTSINQHTRMLNDYLDQMASSLEDLYPSMSMHPEVAIALCFDDLKTSIGYGPKLIDPDVFNQAVNKYDYMGVNVGTWQGVANLGKFSSDYKSPFGTKSPCSNGTQQN